MTVNLEYFLSPTPFFLQCTKARLKVTEKELKDLQWEHEVLEQRFTKVSGHQAGPVAGGGTPASQGRGSPCGPGPWTSFRYLGQVFGF